LPGILIGGRFVGTFQDFEEAVEFKELEIFLKRNEEYDEELDGPSRPMPVAQAVGVPGAATQHQMTPEHLKTRIYAPDASPLRGRTASGRDAIPVNKRLDQFDVSTELSGYGLQGVMASEDELRQLVEDLGLDGDDAGDLVKGLGLGPTNKDDIMQKKEKDNEAKKEEKDSDATKEEKEVEKKKAENEGETETSKLIIPEVRVQADEVPKSEGKLPSSEGEPTTTESDPEVEVPSKAKDEN
jgi:hypothetical protein